MAPKASRFFATLAWVSAAAAGAPKLIVKAPANRSNVSAEAADLPTCLCVFDIDRTLTGKQGDVTTCPNNTKIDVYDEGYGGGQATLSALASVGINETFCNECYLGICSAGHGSGARSEWNNYILDHIMRSSKQDAFIADHPQYNTWSYGENVHSPYVLNQGNTIKQISVDMIRQWYGRHGVDIQQDEVYFFGDRHENIEPFAEYGLNSREISCESRDPYLYGGSGMVGYCGATPEEILRRHGNYVCAHPEFAHPHGFEAENPAVTSWSDPEAESEEDKALDRADEAKNAGERKGRHARHAAEAEAPESVPGMREGRTSCCPEGDESGQSGFVVLP